MIKIHPKFECNICYEYSIVKFCNYDKCNCKVCIDCLRQYKSKKCPVCRQENAFKIVKNKKKCFNYKYIQRIFNYLCFKQIEFFKFIINECKDIPYNITCYNILLLFVITISLLFIGSIMSKILFFDINKIFTILEFIVFSLLGLLLTLFFVFILFCIFLYFS
jgi:hypothetical protein